METRGQPAASPSTSPPPRRCRPDLVHRHRFSSSTQRRAAFSIDLGPERIGERRVTYPLGSLGRSSTRFRVWLLDAQSGDGSGDDELLDLLGAFEDVHDLGVTVPALDGVLAGVAVARSEEHTSELQSLRRTSDAGFCVKNTK